MILETARLRLRPFEPDDAEAVAAYSTSEEFVRYMPLPRQTPESAAAFVARCVAEGMPDTQGNWRFVVEDRETARVIGSIRIGVREPDHQQGDVGYALHQSHWGKGYMTEALERILSFGFSELPLERIWATADVDNIASWRVMEKAGMQREGLMRHHRLIRGQWRDSVLYACLRPQSASR
ncbi:MAG: GNAT family N-acetyltransferase [Novosphingobium sp.]